MKVAIQDLLRKIENNKLNVHEGVFSVCSSNPYVIEASLNKSKETNDFLLIEATCNQVNQFGGYTGKTPEGFSKFIFSLAHKAGFPEEKIILGGDHLGPYPWRNQKAKVAMSNSEDLVRAYVKSGFEKIHLDTSIYCIDDNQSLPMSNQLSADRAVQLCKAAENTASTENIEKPIYVIGTEVPLPGGQQSQDDSLQLTTVENIKETLAIFKETFYREGLSLAWERVVALVVQPGVEFGDNDIIEYQPEKAQSLKEYVENNSEIVYEAHSTDYQTKENLYNLVSDHFAILKVGPALTFSFREAVFGLQKIEEELSKTSREIKKSKLIHTVLQAMDRNPENWKDYYRQSQDTQIMKLFSFSDRIRYYWDDPQAQQSLKLLMDNLNSKDIPLSLISQYLPRQYDHIRAGLLNNNPVALVLDHISSTLDDYMFACKLK